MDRLREYVSAAAGLVREHPFAALAATHAVTTAAFVWSASEGKPFRWLYKKVFQAALAAVPASVMEAEQAKLRKTIEHSVIGSSLDGETLYTTLPETGLATRDIIALLERYSSTDAPKWKRGQVSGTVYHGGEDLTELMTEAFRRFALSNPLHPDVFPLLRKMESEIVAMGVKLFNGGPTACGTMTSGGTESILMAMKAFRDRARMTRGITEPELVVPVTAHAAFDKACAYFGIKLVHIPVDPATCAAVPAAMKAAITRNTIGLVCSAPSYPQGVVDPVPELAAIARGAGIPLHVDCCLGSFLIAFSAAAGFPQPVPFDFSVPGVTSISCDTHKYGFAPKGSSLVMYASPEWRHAQYFVAPEWTGGIYASPTIAGSRPGALVAACWATLMRVGAAGYRDAARKILGSAKGVQDALASGAIPHLTLVGKPSLSVVAFGIRAGSPLSIYHVNDALSSRGWNLNVLQNPASVHVCVTFANADTVAARFVDDLKAAVQEVATAPPGKFKEGSAAIYGMAASIPDKSLVNQVAFSFLDALYKAEKPE